MQKPGKIIGKTKYLLQNVKQAGKIYWNKDKLQALNQKLKEHQSDVTSHLVTRTSMMVNDVGYVQTPLSPLAASLTYSQCRHIVSQSRRLTCFGRPLKAIREAISRLEARLLTVPTGNPHPTPIKKAVFLIPYADNQDFVGRQKIFDELRQCLFQDGTHTHQPRAALWGLGGAGYV